MVDDCGEQAQAVLAQAPPELTTSQFIAWVLDLMARQRFDGNRDQWRLIQSLIDSDEGLQERALRKRATLCSTLGQALQNRGHDQRQTRLLAETTISAFYIADEQWLTSDHSNALDTLAGLHHNLNGIHSDPLGLGTAVLDR